MAAGNHRRGASSHDGLCSDACSLAEADSPQHMVFHFAASPQLLERSDVLCVGFLPFPCCLVMFPKPHQWTLASVMELAGLLQPVPLCLALLSHSSALSKSSALKHILLNFEALQTIQVSSFECKCPIHPRRGFGCPTCYLVSNQCD